MTYRKIIPVCSGIHSKHTNKTLWAERRILRRIRKIVKSDYYLNHVCLSVLPPGTTRIHWKDFHKILIFQYFSKICPENSCLVKM